MTPWACFSKIKRQIGKKNQNYITEVKTNSGQSFFFSYKFMNNLAWNINGENKRCLYSYHHFMMQFTWKNSNQNHIVKIRLIVIKPIFPLNINQAAPIFSLHHFFFDYNPYNRYIGFYRDSNKFKFICTIFSLITIHYNRYIGFYRDSNKLKFLENKN